MVTMQIWTNRLLKEFDGIESRLPPGVILSSHAMDPEAGVCKAVFEAAISMPSSGSTEDDADGVSKDDSGVAESEESGADQPQASEDTAGEGANSDLGGRDGKSDGEAPTASEDEEEKGVGAVGEEERPARKPKSVLRFKVEMDLGLDTRYPFESPVIRVVEGDDVIPSATMTGDLIVMPGSDSWTPSNTVIATLEDIVDMVMHAEEAGLPTGQGDEAGALERGDLRPGSLVSTEALGEFLYPCTPETSSQLFLGSVLGSRSNRPLDRYIGVTDRQVLELEAHLTRMNQAVVVEAVDMTALAKLKFRRGVSVALVLKSGETKEYPVAQSHECVVAVTQRLQNMGIPGHQTTAGAERQVDKAQSLMSSLTRKETAFGTGEQPSLAEVEECMDLFRQAAELYSAAGDKRHREVLTHMHEFLQRPDVMTALEVDDAAIERSAGSLPADVSALRGEVLPKMPSDPRFDDDGVLGGGGDDDGVGLEEHHISEGTGLDELQKMLDGASSSPTSVPPATADAPPPPPSGASVEVSSEGKAGAVPASSSSKESADTARTPPKKKTSPSPIVTSGGAGGARPRRSPMGHATPPSRTGGAGASSARVLGRGARSPLTAAAATASGRKDTAPSSAKKEAGPGVKSSRVEGVVAGGRGRGRGRTARGGAVRGARGRAAKPAGAS